MEWACRETTRMGRNTAVSGKMACETEEGHWKSGILTTSTLVSSKITCHMAMASKCSETSYTKVIFSTVCNMAEEARIAITRMLNRTKAISDVALWRAQAATLS